MPIRKTKLCKAIKSNGKPCGAPAVGTHGYCYWHDETRAAERTAARLKGTRATAARSVTPELKAEFVIALDTAGDVKGMLAKLIRDLLTEPRVDERNIKRARCVGYLAGVLLAAITTSDLEARVAALEKGRPGP